MQISIERNALNSALLAVKRVVEKRNYIPILSNVLLRSADNVLTLRTTDLDRESTLQIPCETIFPGEMTVPAHSLSDMVKALASGAQINLDKNETGAALSSGGTRMSLPTLPTEDFPSLVEHDFPHSFEMPGADLARLIAATSFAISTEETRYYLCGIYLHIADGKLRAVTTDGHRLACADVALLADAAGMPGIILPTLAIAELAKLLAKHKGAVGVRVSRKQAEFTVGMHVLLTKTIDGTFPDYRRVAPRTETGITVSRAALLGLCKLVGLGKETKTKFTFAAGSLTAHSRDPDVGEKSASISCEGAAIGEVGAPLRQIVDSLGAAVGDKLTWSFCLKNDRIDPGSPFRLATAESPAEYSVIMPVRV